MTRWQINIREEGPLLEALALRVPSAPQAFLRQLCKKERVTLDGKNVGSDCLARQGGTIEVKGSGRWLDCLQQLTLQPAQILYEDDSCLVIDKPAGLAIHHALGQDDNLLSRVKAFLQRRRETFQVAPIHRLDIGTSGAVLFGKGHASISRLGKAIMAGQMTKRYLALVDGHILLPGDLSSEVPAKGRSKESLTRFRPVENAGGSTLLDLELVTGRHHQIRYQLAAAGWPIVGDKRYRGRMVGDMHRPFLHCHSLTLQLDDSERTIQVSCRLPEELQKILEALGFTSEV